MYFDSLESIRPIITFVLILALSSMGVMYLARRLSKQREVLEERLGTRPKTSDSGRTLRLWRDGEEATLTVATASSRRSIWSRLAQHHLDAGWKIPLRTMLLGLALTSLGVFLVLFMSSGRAIPSSIGGAAVIVIVWWRGNQRQVKRAAIFDQQLIDGLELSARALRSGHPLLASFQLISEEIPAPVGKMFAEICQQQAMGVGMEEAVRSSAERTNSADMQLFSASLAIHLRSGGNLAEVMEGLAHVIRDRIRLSRRFRVLTAQTQFSKKVLLIMPFAMFGVLNAISPEYMSELYSTSTGNLLLLISGGCLALGWYVMERMSSLKV